VLVHADQGVHESLKDALQLGHNLREPVPLVELQPGHEEKRIWWQAPAPGEWGYSAVYYSDYRTQRRPSGQIVARFVF
jgi:hypothetical protein